MFECSWVRDGFECWTLDGDLRGASRRWQHRLGEELWLWLNVSGQGVVWGREHRIFLKPGLFGCFAAEEEEPWKWTRLPGHHEGRILVIPKDYVRALAAKKAATDRRAVKWLAGQSGLAFVGLMGPAHHRLAGLLPGSSRGAGLPAPVRRAVDSCLKGILSASVRKVESVDEAAEAKSKRTSRRVVRSETDVATPVSEKAIGQ